MKKAIVTAGLVGLLGPVLAITLGYTDYGMLGISIADALRPVWRWPILSLPFLLTPLSISIPFVAYFFRDKVDPDELIAVYALGYLWIPLLVLYPGARGLGLVSDGAAFFTLPAIYIAQYVAAKITLKAIHAHAAGGAV